MKAQISRKTRKRINSDTKEPLGSWSPFKIIFSTDFMLFFLKMKVAQQVSLIKLVDVQDSSKLQAELEYWWYLRLEDEAQQRASRIWFKLRAPESHKTDKKSFFFFLVENCVNMSISHVDTKRDFMPQNIKQNMYRILWLRPWRQNL